MRFGVWAMGCVLPFKPRWAESPAPHPSSPQLRDVFRGERWARLPHATSPSGDLFRVGSLCGADVLLGSEILNYKLSESSSSLVLNYLWNFLSYHLCFYSDGGFSYWWGFGVLSRALEEESSNCRCRGEGEEARAPRMVPPGCSMDHIPDHGWLPEQFSCGALYKRGGYYHCQSPARNHTAFLEFSLAPVVHLTRKGCCDKFLHVQGQHGAGWVSANTGAEWFLCCVCTVAEHFQN